MCEAGGSQDRGTSAQPSMALPRASGGRHVLEMGCVGSCCGLPGIAVCQGSWFRGNGVFCHLFN